MTTPREEWSLGTEQIGKRVLVFERVDSTNSLAVQLTGDPASHGTVILAAEQTAGRGQFGRPWVASPSSSVLLSLALFPPPSLRRPAILTAWAAVAVCSTIHELIGWQARIKWPNDVLLGGRKVCGILIEQGQGIVTGIGLNVQQTAEDLAEAGLPEASSLQMHTSEPLQTLAVARTLILHLDRSYASLCQGDLSSLEDGWQRHLGLLGKTVRAECHQGWYQGRLHDVGFAGLHLHQPSGPPLVLPPEKVLHLEAV